MSQQDVLQEQLRTIKREILALHEHAKSEGGNEKKWSSLYYGQFQALLEEADHEGRTTGCYENVFFGAKIAQLFLTYRRDHLIGVVVERVIPA